MALENAVLAILVQSASHSVQATDPGSGKTAPDHASSSTFDSWCHTEEPSFHLVYSVQKSFVMNQRFHLLQLDMSNLLLEVFSSHLLMITTLNCCSVRRLSHKLLTLRPLSSDSVVPLVVPDLFLWEFAPFSECLLMVKVNVLTDTLTLFTISL